MNYNTFIKELLEEVVRDYFKVWTIGKDYVEYRLYAMPEMFVELTEYADNLVTYRFVIELDKSEPASQEFRFNPKSLTSEDKAKVLDMVINLMVTKNGIE